MSKLRNVWLHRLVGLVVGAVFAYASLAKIGDPPAFARIVYHYQLIGPNQLLPPLAPNLLAVTLPWVEVLCGLLLIVGIWRREAALLTAGMLIMFIAAVGWTLYHGIDVENCGCFSLGSSGRRAGWLLIGEDTALLVGALLLVVWPPLPLRGHDT